MLISCSALHFFWQPACRPTPIFYHLGKQFYFFLFNFVVLRETLICEKQKLIFFVLSKNRCSSWESFTGNGLGIVSSDRQRKCRALHFSSVYCLNITIQLTMFPAWRSA